MYIEEKLCLKLPEVKFWYYDSYAIRAFTSSYVGLQPKFRITLSSLKIVIVPAPSKSNTEKTLLHSCMKLSVDEETVLFKLPLSTIEENSSIVISIDIS